MWGLEGLWDFSGLLFHIFKALCLVNDDKHQEIPKYRTKKPVIIFNSHSQNNKKIMQNLFLEKYQF